MSLCLWIQRKKAATIRNERCTNIAIMWVHWTKWFQIITFFFCASSKQLALVDLLRHVSFTRFILVIVVDVDICLRAWFARFESKIFVSSDFTTVFMAKHYFGSSLHSVQCALECVHNKYRQPVPKSSLPVAVIFFIFCMEFMVYCPYCALKWNINCAYGLFYWARCDSRSWKKETR